MTIKFLACTNCRALSGTVFYVLPDRWVNFWQQEHLGHFLGEGRENRPSSVHGTCASVPVAHGRGCGATQRAAHVIPRRARWVGFCACVVQKIATSWRCPHTPPGPIGLLGGCGRDADGLPGRHRWADCVATALPFARAVSGDGDR